MKKQSLFRMGFLILCLWVFSAQAQTRVVNQSTYSLGRPSLLYEYSRGLPIGNGNIVYFDNYYNSINSPDNEDFQLGVINLDTGPVNIVDYFSLHGGSSPTFGTNMSVHGNNIYACAFTTDSTFTNKTLCNIFKLDLNGDTIWVIGENIDSSLQQVPFVVLSDDSGVYMGASVKTATGGYKITVIKYSQSGARLWRNDLDTTIPVLPVAMAFSGSTYLTITGFEWDNLGNSNFLTYYLNRSTGIGGSPKLTANGVGAISHPCGLATDTLIHNYIAGTSTVSGINSIFKLIVFDSAFNLLTTSVWGDSSKPNQATSMCMDGPEKHIYITGSSPNTSGGTDLIVLRYNTDGTLSWSKRLSAPNPANSMGGVSITSGQDYSAYVTGWVFNGVDTNVVTAAIDTGGALLWQQVYARTFTSTDVPYSISMGDDGMTVHVTIRSIGPDSQYVMLTYKQDGTINAPDSTVPSQQWAYYENKGQVIDTGTNQASYVRYYTNTSNPRLYITDYALSYVFKSGDSITDSLQRIDMTLGKSEIGSDPTTPTYYGTEQIKPYFNYYIGGLPQYYEDVHGYQRITVKGIYNNIDCQLYSDSGGLKYYYVVNPGGSPTDIQFKYTGADSITHDSTGMKIYSRYGVANQLPFTAWQYSGGTATQISLGLSVVSSTEFTFTTGSYNTSLPLFIRMTQQPQAAQSSASIDNLTWSTYLGGSGDNYAQDIDIDNHHQQYVTGYTTTTNFPVGTGQTFQGTGNRGSFLSQFDSLSRLDYSTFYGGSNLATSATLHIKHNTNAVAAGYYQHYDGLYQTVYIAGQTTYTDLPCPKSRLFSGGLNDTTYNGGQADGFVALFNGYNGALQQASYIGSDGEDGINTLEIDRDTTRNYNELYLGGYTMGTNFPFQNAVSSSFYDNEGRAVLMQLDENMNAVWTTGFGSHDLTINNNNTDSLGCTINDIKLDNSGNLLIVGNSYFSFPSGSPYSISQPTGAFRVPTHPNTSTTPPTNAFLAKFTPGTGSAKNKYSLYYFSEYGDNEKDDGEKICANSAGDIYIAGQGSRDYLPLQPQDSSFDYVANSDGGYLVKFSPDGALLENGDFGGDLQITFGDIFCDASDNVFMYGASNVTATRFSLVNQSGWYYDGTLGTKCFVAEINTSNTLVWSSFFGGYLLEFAGGMCIDGNNMYICGKTQGSGFQTVSDNVASYSNTFTGTGLAGGDAYVARFKLLDVYPLSVSNMQSTNSNIKCYPNPSNGMFKVSFQNFETGDKTVTLYNYMGQKVYTIHTTDNSIMINEVDQFSTGVYIVDVQSNNKKEVAKIIISKE